MISLSSLVFAKNAITQVQMTFVGDSGSIGSDVTGLRLSLNGESWSDMLVLDEAGTYTLYVKTRGLDGSYTDAIGWSTLDGSTSEEGSFDIYVGSYSTPKYESISFGFGPRNTTVQFNANLSNTQDMFLGRRLTGNVLDYSYDFEVERVAEQGHKSVVNASAFATKLTQQMIIYRVTYTYDILHLGWVRPTLNDHLQAIASEINIPITLIGRNFYPKTDMNIMLRKGLGSIQEVISGSFGELLDRLIGWSSDVPEMTYNVHVDSNGIKIIQQGYEQNTFVLDDEWTLLPTITHSKRRTQWAESQYQSVIPKEISSSDAANSNEPFTGVITWNGISRRYEDGYLMEENDGAGKVTTYTYTDANEGKYMASKTVTYTPEGESPETVSVTTYTYQVTGTQMYLYEEQYTGYDVGTVIESRLTRHVPVGGGWYGTTVYDTLDGEEEIGNSLSQGAPGNKVSQYCTDKANNALKPANTPMEMVVPLDGVAKARQSFPVADYNTLSTIADFLDSHENVEEIQVSGEVVGLSHIINFNDKVSFNGNNYYVVSNNVTQTYNKIRQSLTLVRWVLRS